MEAEPFTVCPFQYCLEPLPNGGWVHRGVLLDRGGEHPSGVDSLSIFFHHMKHRSWKEYSPPACRGFGRGYHQFPTHPVNLSFHLERSRFEIQVIPLEGADLTPAQTGG